MPGRIDGPTDCGHETDRHHFYVRDVMRRTQTPFWYYHVEIKQLHETRRSTITAEKLIQSQKKNRHLM